MASAVDQPVTVRPPTSIVPASQPSMPLRIFMSVLFPAPFSPTSA